MKEQGPTRLTNQANSLNLRRGGILMSTQPGNGGPEFPFPVSPAVRETVAHLRQLDAEGVNVDVRRAARDLRAEVDARGRATIFSVEGITNEPLLAEAKTLERMISSGIADRDSLKAAYERIDKLDAPEAEKGVLLGSIAEAA
ncbi:MAG: hypothetical protein ABSD69_01085, partial [Candidatus Levyibacteriota bacterium]